jgi:hypothetical protein
MAKFMNQATGGDEYVSGKVDVHPESIDYLIRFYMGGLGRFADNTYETGKVSVKKARGEDAEFEMRKVPFARVVAGEPDAYANQAKYRQRKDEINQLYQSYKNADKSAKNDEKYKGVVELYFKLKSSDKLLKIAREQKDNADDKDNYTGMRAAEDRSSAIISGFNKRYNELRK